MWCATIHGTQMHELKTPYFSVLLYYDKVIKLLAPAFHCCSHNEASRLGRFLGETLHLLHHWKEDPNIYKKECQQHPGFKKSLTDPKAMAISYGDFVPTPRPLLLRPLPHLLLVVREGTHVCFQSSLCGGSWTVTRWLDC